MSDLTPQICVEPFLSALRDYLQRIDTSYIDSLDPKASLLTPNLRALFTEFTVTESFDTDFYNLTVHAP